MCDMLIFVIGKPFLNIFSNILFDIFLILPCTLTIKVEGIIFFCISRPWKVGQGTCITLPYLNSKSKIIGGGGKHPPPSHN